MRKGIMRAARTYFFTGLVVLLPVIVTLYILWAAFSLTDNFLGSIIELFFGRRVPGAGAVLTLLLTLGVGVFAANVMGRKIIVFLESLVSRIPLVRSIYQSVKQLLDAFGTNKMSFKQVVMVEFPREGMYSIGFLTNEQPKSMARVLDQDVVTAFVPTIPNITTGFFLLIPREKVKFLDLSVEEGLKMIISAGVFTPAEPDAEPSEKGES